MILPEPTRRWAAVAKAEDINRILLAFVTVEGFPDKEVGERFPG